MTSSAESSRPAAAPGARDVAIVGMACVMPGAPDLETFWSNIVDGVDSVTEVPASRWNVDYHFDPDFDGAARTASGKEHKTVSKWGGFIPDVGFDALRWGIPPASLASIDPAQITALKAAADALDDAGYGDGGFDRSRASVVYATGSGGAADLPAGFLLRLLLRNHGVTVDQLPDDLDAFLPRLTEDGLPGVLTSVIAGRVANRLDLGGKNLTVDSACASVLVALDICCNELAGGSSDLVLCGGVDLHNGAQDYLSFTAAQALSRSGRCRSFDADADGMTLAEGAGCIVLKRLADAEQDGDRIYAVIRGIAGSSDGRHLGLTAPRQQGQELAVRRAYAAAGRSPAEVGLVEAHGTGTATGDRVELATTTQIFGEAGVTPRSVVIGSVKSNVGHTKCASGLASLIKSAKAAYHGVLPPTLHIRRPNEVYDPETSPFVFLDRARPWLADRRLVGVSSFGFGGTNFHAILENHRPAQARAAVRVPDTAAGAGRRVWPAELFAVRAASDADLHARLDALAERVDAARAVLQADRWRLRDVAAAVSAAGDGPVRLAIVARDLDDLAAKLAAARSGSPAAGVHRRAGGTDGDPAGDTDGDPADGTCCPRVAFLFAGAEGARPGMAADVLVALPATRAATAGQDTAVAALLPPQAFDGEAEAQRNALGAVAGPAAAVAGLVVARALAALGVVPDAVADRGGAVVPSREEAEAVRRWLADAAAPSPASSPAGSPAGSPAPPAVPGAPHAGAGPERDARLVDEVRALNAGGVDVFVEVGPGDALTALVDDALDGVPHLAVAADRPGEHGLVALLDAVARLAVAGVPVDLAALHAGRDARPERWDDPPRAPGWLVNGHYVKTAAGGSLPNGLRPAAEAPTFRIVPGDGAAADGAPAPSVPAVAGDAAAGAALGGAEVAVVLEYLRILQGMVAAGSALVSGHVAAGGS
ncbi:MAG TPA: beta-ketoacyl synthase N-terminal-like domain-containing protein [Acidimicrobiales bacterium]|nr:beta-ketoacyl synthase N-terminal-like domain-containing protein [Acidimicrobiales bacterium]